MMSCELLWSGCFRGCSWYCYEGETSRLLVIPRFGFFYRFSGFPGYMFTLDCAVRAIELYLSFSS